MRHAPPVSVLCRGRGWRVVQTALAGLCVAVLGAWLAQHLSHPGFDSLAAAAAAAVPAVLVAWRLAQQPAVTLRWDGHSWQADGEAAQVALMLDLGFAVLLRWQPAAGRPRWTAVPSNDAGAAWHALRVALHAHGAPVTRQPAPW